MYHLQRRHSVDRHTVTTCTCITYNDATAWTDTAKANEACQTRSDLRTLLCNKRNLAFNYGAKPAGCDIAVTRDDTKTNDNQVSSQAPAAQQRIDNDVVIAWSIGPQPTRRLAVVVYKLIMCLVSHVTVTSRSFLLQSQAQIN